MSSKRYIVTCLRGAEDVKDNCRLLDFSYLIFKLGIQAECGWRKQLELKELVELS